MKLTDQFWKQSILVRLGIAMGLIALLALASILSSAIFTERSEGKAGAINVAGSLRMQSYLIASTVASLHFRPDEKRRELERNLAACRETPTRLCAAPMNVFAPSGESGSGRTHAGQ